MFVTGIVLAAGNAARFRAGRSDDQRTASGSGPRLGSRAECGGRSGGGSDGGSGAAPSCGSGGGSDGGSGVAPSCGSGGGGGTKQLLPYRGRTLVDAALDLARECAFDQRIVTLGESAAAVRARVDLRGFTVVDVPAAGSGCGASVSTAVGAVDPRADGLVLLLGDQPQVRAAVVAALISAAGGSPLGVCRYDDGLGHPFWFRREVFAALRGLHGDKAVWKLLHSGEFVVTEARVAGSVPIDVDTPADYERLLVGDHLVG